MTLLVLTILTIIFIAVPLGLWSDKENEVCFDYESDDESSERYPFLFLPNDGDFLLCEKGKTQLRASLGKHHNYIKEERVNVYTYSDDTVLNITRLNENCLRMEWTGISSVEAPLMDCFQLKDELDMKDLEWFGAHELYTQNWPLSNMDMNITPFLPHDYLADTFITYQSRNTFGPVLHPLWLTSNGAGILVEQVTPLSVSINESGNGELCLQAVPYALECIPKSFEKTKLHYTICINDTIAETAKYFLRGCIPHPRDVPARETFDIPIWSTWGAFKTNINNDTIRNYLTEIEKYGLGISQLEIDDGYGENGVYGDLSMNIDTKALADRFKVSLTAWVHPFVNLGATTLTEKLDDNYFLPGKSKIEGDSVSLVKWWHDYGAVVNYLDNRVIKAQRQALVDFMSNYSLISLKFDAGEVTYLPKCVFTRNVDDPGEFATAYSAFVGNFSDKVSSRAEVRVGYFSQGQPQWVRMLDRSSTWGIDNGLKSVLTTALTFGIAGYPFVLADMIGGNGATPTDNDRPADPNPTLFVRWMQLNAFLPSMQFSVPPFHDSFSNVGFNVTKHALDLIEIHRNLTNTLYNLALQAKETGYPIIRPVWWIDGSMESIFVDDQFLIGDDIMIAPILEDSSGIVSRCVYFPYDTHWKRYGHDGTYPNSCKRGDCEHGCVFSVQLLEFLYFRRV